MKSNKKNEKKGLIKAMGMMMGCCLAPVVIVTLFTIGGNIFGFSAGANRIVPFLSSLICPIMMIGMMFSMMGKKGHSCCEEDKEDELKR